MALNVSESDSAVFPNVDRLVAVIGDALVPMGFHRRDERVLQSDLYIYSFTPPTDRDDLINVIVDRKTSAITLVEYRRQRSSLADRVKKILEARIADNYHISAQFKDLPCQSSWP